MQTHCFDAVATFRVLTLLNNIDTGTLKALKTENGKLFGLEKVLCRSMSLFSECHERNNSITVRPRGATEVDCSIFNPRLALQR